jgi:hypothetical protein
VYSTNVTKHVWLAMEDDCWRAFAFEKREQLGGFYRAEGGLKEMARPWGW